MTSNQHDPYVWGYTRDTMASTNRSKMVTWSKSDQNWSQFGLWSATRPHEVGIASKRVSVTAR